MTTPRWGNPGHRAEPADATAAGDAQLAGDLEAVVHLQEQTKGPKVFPSEALRVDLGNLHKPLEAVLDLVLVPVLVGEANDEDERKLNTHAVEVVRCFFRLLKLQHGPCIVDGPEELKGVTGSRELIAKQHRTHGRWEQIDRQQGRHRAKGVADVHADLKHGYMRLDEGEQQALGKLTAPRGHLGFSMARTSLLQRVTQNIRAGVHLGASILLARRSMSDLGTPFRGSTMTGSLKRQWW